MNNRFENLIYHWFRSMKIPVSKTYLKQQLQSHHDYPSLISITDTLDNFNIPNGAYAIEKEKLNEVPLPFLAHSGIKGGEFELVTNIEKHLQQHPDFIKQWDGIAVIAEKSERLENSENEKQLHKEKSDKRLQLFFASIIIALSLFSLWNHFSLPIAALLLTTIAGVFTGLLIVQEELGISNEFTEQLCAAGKNTDCHAVIHSKAGSSRNSKWMQWLNLGTIGLADAVIIYFSSLFLLLTVSLYNNSTPSFINLFFIISVATLPVTLFSIYYQWRVVKKWCTLCLATVALLWIQFALIFGAETGAELDEASMIYFGDFSTNTILLSAFIFISVTAAWTLLVKPALQKNIELQDKNFSLLRFKNDPKIFNALLRGQRTVDTTAFENDLQLGNPDADLQIMVACNPYCGPCAQTHKILHELLEKNDMGLTVRFTIKTENKEDKGLHAVQYLLQLAQDKLGSYKRKTLHDWYNDMSFEKFSAMHPLKNENDVQEILKQNEEWSNKSEIKFTPTIFINGYQLPGQYRASDLNTMLRNKEQSHDLTGQQHIAENELIPV